MAEIVLFTSLHQADNAFQFDFCKLLTLYSKHTVYLYYPNENRSKIWNSLPKIKIWDKPIRSLTNKTIILFGYSSTFLDLDASNKIIYLTMKDYLSDLQLTLISKLSGVIAPTVHGANFIAHQAMSYNLQLSTTNLIPWLDAKNYQITKQIKGKAATLPYNKGDQASYGVVDNVSDILQLMLSGKPVIAPCQFQELVINNYNGFIASTPHEVLISSKKINSIDTMEFGKRSRQIVEALLSPMDYIRKLDEYLEKLPILPRPTIKDSAHRKWVITNKVMQNGVVFNLPQEIDSVFSTIEYTDILTVLNFLANQVFAEAYVFGFEFPNCSAQELNQLKILTHRLGDRAKKIFFCIDSPVPSEWTAIFNNLGIMTQTEGLKQVK